MSSLRLLTKALRTGNLRILSSPHVIHALDLHGDKAYALIKKLELLAVLREARRELSSIEKSRNIERCRALRLAGC